MCRFRSFLIPLCAFCGENVPAVMSSYAAVTHNQFLRFVLKQTTKFAVHRDGRRVIADPPMKCWYGYISTDVCSGNYDDDITALTITWLRMVRRENSQHQRMEYNHILLMFMPLLYILIKLFTTNNNNDFNY